MDKRKILHKSKRIVVKVGTSLLTRQDNRLNKAFLRKLCEEICVLLDDHKEVILVSSGAIGAGMGVLGFDKRPKTLPQLQACAAVGQGELMKVYATLFARRGYMAAQVLLTQDGLTDRVRYLNARNTLHALSDQKVVPVINENDTVSVDEIKFGDNDRLSALVSNVVDADCLIILSDVDGLYRCATARKASDLIPVVDEVNDTITACASSSSRESTVGGMVTKLQAAKVAVLSGIPVIIANGREKNILSSVLAGEEKGTFFVPKSGKVAHRKRWLAFTSHPKGSVTVDKGAHAALCERGKSLLASGVVSCEGSFKQGDCVRVVSARGKELALGLTNYAVSDLKRICGKKTAAIKEILGASYYGEVIHRDNLMIL